MVGRLRHLRLRRPPRVRAGQLRLQVSGKTGIYRQRETKKRRKKSQFGALCTHLEGGGSHVGRDVAPVPKDWVPHLSSIPGGGAQTGRDRRWEEDEPGPKKGLGKQFRKSLFLSSPPPYIFSPRREVSKWTRQSERGSKRRRGGGGRRRDHKAQRENRRGSNFASVRRGGERARCAKKRANLLQQIGTLPSSAL